ncbi:MAG: sensor histidine kinase [Cellulosilyticaceae bacterium]
MKKIARLNQQLLVTVGIIIIGSIMVFGMILPMIMKIFFDNTIYSQIIAIQNQLDIESIQQYDGYDNIYHILYSRMDESIDVEISEELLHHRLMYKDFFLEIDEKVRAQQEPVGMYQHTQGYETIYWVINKTCEEDILISYKIEVSDSIFANGLLSKLLVLIGITLGIILVIFYKWSNRLINNLKDIQLKLDEIGEGHLETPINSDHYTIEFQEVMVSLEQMRHKLYTNDQVKKDMIHNISHDLKTPLAVIKNYAEGIIDGVHPYGSVEETACVIYSQAERLQKRVQSLLYLNRLEYIKGQNQQASVFEMRPLLLEVVAYMKACEGEDCIQMAVDESEFVGDIEKWRIVLENLIDNAKRYANQEIRIVVKEGVLSIYNDGEAIEETTDRSLFEAFEVGKGGVTGLGLAIAKKTVELYGYHIVFVNEKQGVTFVIAKNT